MLSSVQLKVAEAKQQRDVGRSIARMDSETMKTIGVTVGDVVEVVGDRVRHLDGHPEHRPAALRR